MKSKTSIIILVIAYLPKQTTSTKREIPSTHTLPTATFKHKTCSLKCRIIPGRIQFSHTWQLKEFNRIDYLEEAFKSEMGSSHNNSQ